MNPTPNESSRERLLQLLADSKEMERGFQDAVQQALQRHKEMGNSIAIWEEGRVVIIPAEEIVL